MANCTGSDIKISKTQIRNGCPTRWITLVITQVFNGCKITSSSVADGFISRFNSVNWSCNRCFKQSWQFWDGQDIYYGITETEKNYVMIKHGKNYKTWGKINHERTEMRKKRVFPRNVTPCKHRQMKDI